MSRAEQASDRAALWIIAREDGAWSDGDQAALDDWLRASDGNKAAYWRLRYGLRDVDRIRALGRARDEDAEVRAPRPTYRWWPAAIAASIVAVVGIGLVKLGPSAGPTPGVQIAAYTTPIGGRRTIGLDDGSRIQLNTASSVRTAVDGRQRTVWLDDGEAFFDVARREGRPFVVNAGNRRVTVLGTKFSVRRERDKVTVTVLQGRVRVDEVAAPANGHGTRSAVIMGGDIALAQGPSTLVTTRSEQRVANALAWRTGMLTFDQMRLADVAVEFNRYSVRPMIVKDAEAGDIRIGGAFPAADPAAFARLLRDAYGLKVEQTPSAIIISN